MLPAPSRLHHAGLGQQERVGTAARHAVERDHLLAGDFFHGQRRGGHLVGDLTTQEAAQLARHVESRAAHADVRHQFKRLGHQVDEVGASAGILGQVGHVDVGDADHIAPVAQHGADVVTCPLSAILGLLKHPLTDIGLAQFLADHAKGSK